MLQQATSPDSLTLIMLCSQLALPKGDDRGANPLSAIEWNRLAKRVTQSCWSHPADLLGRDTAELASTLALDEKPAARLAQLLDRGGQVAIELERLESRGISVLTLYDEGYPARLASRLHAQAPAVLFVAGPRRLLASGGLAIVGSRDIDADGASFATSAGRRCAEQGIVVVSGAARGVDQLSMTAAIEHGGAALGIPADGLERLIQDRAVRSHVVDGRLTFATPFHPAARFDVGNAMSRNKLIYCLADAALVVSSAEEGGGTRAGALEDLRATWVPLFVRTGPDSPEGNRDLVRRGGNPVDAQSLASADGMIALVTPSSRGQGVSRADSGCSLQPDIHAVTRDEAEPCQTSAEADASVDMFTVFWPHLERFLVVPRTDRDVASSFRLELSQARAWLSRAVGEGMARRLGRPIRYALPKRDPEPVMARLL